MKKRILSTLVTFVIIMMSFMSVIAMVDSFNTWFGPTEYFSAQYIDADGKIQTAYHVKVIDEGGFYPTGDWYIDHQHIRQY